MPFASASASSELASSISARCPHSPSSIGVGPGPPVSLFPHAGTRVEAASAIASAETEVESCMNVPSYFASGSGRSWKWIALLVCPFPPSMWNGARVLIEAQSPRPFQPAFGSSIRPSIHLV